MIKFLRPATLLSLILVLLYSSCKKDRQQPNVLNNPPDLSYHINLPDSADDNHIQNASLDISANTSGQAVPDDFLGFSFEKQIMTDPAYFTSSNTSFINMFKNLGNGLVRIGGSTVDRTFFSKSKRPNDSQDTLYSDDVNRYKAFAQVVGWKTLWGLNLGTGTPQNAAEEARYVSDNLPGQIASYAIGNEPEFYGNGSLRQLSYTLDDYAADFDKFYSYIKTSVPGAVFSGPENQISGFTNSFLQKMDGKINMLTFHYYMMGPANSPNVSMNDLLRFDIQLAHLADSGSQYARQLKIPYRVTECNSVWAGGQQGISNAFSSALWGSEFLFYLAQQGAAGINFHTGGPATYIYSPVNMVAGKSVARPLYYAMLLFHQANIKQFTTHTLANNANINIDAYSFITNDNKSGVVIINKDVLTDLKTTIRLSTPIKTATVYQLIAPSLTSLNGTNINGAVVDADGNFSVNGQQFAVGEKYPAVLVKVKAASAMLITFN